LNLSSLLVAFDRQFSPPSLCPRLILPKFTDRFTTRQIEMSRKGGQGRQGRRMELPDRQRELLLGQREMLPQWTLQNPESADDTM